MRMNTGFGKSFRGEEMESGTFDVAVREVRRDVAEIDEQYAVLSEAVVISDAGFIDVAYVIWSQLCELNANGNWWPLCQCDEL